MAQKLIWIGPRESDTLYSGLDFFHTVTFNGSNVSGNISYTSQIATRIDYISQGEKWHLKRFLRHALQPFLEDPDVRFLFYNSAQGYSLNIDITERMLCANAPDLLAFLRNKANMRIFAEECIPVVPYVHFTGKTFPNVSLPFFKGNDCILQNVHSSGGVGTHHFSQKECMDYISSHAETEEYILSPYIESGIPINVHMIIFEHSCIVFPPSYQLIDQQDKTFSYIGADFHTTFSAEQHHLISSSVNSLGEKMRHAGYRGICGIDLILTKNKLFFLEINPRFQASSFLVNKLLLKEGKPSLHMLNMLAFSDDEPHMESFSQFKEPESFFTINGDWFPRWLKEAASTSNTFEFIRDGLTDDMKLMPKAYLSRAVTPTRLCWIDPDYRLRLAPNIQRDAEDWRQKILSLDILALKIGLLNQGIRFSENAYSEMEKQGSVRAGVFQSIDLTFDDGLVINSPYHTRFSELTPYCIEWTGEKFFLSYENIPLCPVSLSSADPYRNKTASSGTIYRNAVFLATDRLRVHHEFRCRFKMAGEGCRFCNVKPKSGNFSIEDVCEIIDFYLEHVDFRHFLIGGGSGDDINECNNILTLARHIRSKSDKPIYAMCLPPKNTSVLSEFYASGINEVGFNLELFDRTVAKKIMPGKGSIPLTQYEDAYREAVRLWGHRGAVRSLMVLGLEPLKSYYQGIEWLCKNGVMPIISIFRPMDNIELNYALPQGNKELMEIYYRSSAIAAKYGLILGPNCTACQNNTLSLPL